MSKRRDYTSEELNIIFAKGLLRRNPLNGKIETTDFEGHIIKRLDYGDVSSYFGWEVDHIDKVKDGGSDDISNLRPRWIPANRADNE